jgi:hypothetical protein
METQLPPGSQTASHTGTQLFGQIPVLPA